MTNTFNLADAKGFVLDMDGVLYHGNVAIPGAREFLDGLTAAGIPWRLLTNNASATPEQYVAKLAAMDIRAETGQIMTSSLATAAYVKHLAPDGARVYVVGGDGIQEAIRRAGFEVVTRPPADFVVVGIDWSVTYDKLKWAALCIRGGAQFIGTNGDKTFPHSDGIIPGNGAQLAFLQAATDVTPIIIGKPQPEIFRSTVWEMGTPIEQTPMIGDRLDTDIQGAAAAGMPTIMVLTGVHTRADAAAAAVKPTLIMEDIAALDSAWRAAHRVG
ncbi:MAG: HAD-IIA family hydrolase [Anaerolineae bacterium]